MANWYAGNNSTDSGNNTGWIFTAPPGGNTFTLVLDDITVAATGSTTHNGTLSVTLGDLTPAFTGTLVHAGAFALTLDGIVVAILGEVRHNGTLAVQLDDVFVEITGQVSGANSFSLILESIIAEFNGTVAPPTPVSVITKGGITKRTKNYKNQREDVEKDVSKAINKVLGIEEPEDHVIIEEANKIPERDNSHELRELALSSQVNALSKTIGDYESAVAQAELDDEEAILLLL
jgi:hypothetical protein